MSKYDDAIKIMNGRFGKDSLISIATVDGTHPSVRSENNAVIMEKLRKAFASWYSNGHVNEDDPNTCLLCVRLKDGVITDHEKKYGEWQYRVDFAKQTA